MAGDKPKKKKSSKIGAGKGSKIRASPVEEVSSNLTPDAEGPTPDAEEPKLVITRPALLDPTAKKYVTCKITDSVLMPGGGPGRITLVKGTRILVPVAVIEDLRRSGCVH